VSLRSKTTLIIGSQVNKVIKNRGRTSRVAREEKKGGRGKGEGEPGKAPSKLTNIIKLEKRKRCTRPQQASILTKPTTHHSWSVG
jgi:hypothetical protein